MAFALAGMPICVPFPLYAQMLAKDMNLWRLADTLPPKSRLPECEETEMALDGKPVRAFRIREGRHAGKYLVM